MQPWRIVKKQMLSNYFVGTFRFRSVDILIRVYSCLVFLEFGLNLIN